MFKKEFLILSASVMLLGGCVKANQAEEAEDSAPVSGQYEVVELYQEEFPEEDDTLESDGDQAESSEDAADEGLENTEQAEE